LDDFVADALLVLALPDALAGRVFVTVPSGSVCFPPEEHAARASAVLVASATTAINGRRREVVVEGAF
jgi:hypothetical protein